MTPRQGFTIWLTGLHCSGKSTLAGLLQQAVSKAGCAVEILVGDEVRQRLSPTLGFSKAEREEQLRRIAYVAQLLTRVGAVAMSRLFLPTVPRAIMPRTHSGALWRCTWIPPRPHHLPTHNLLYSSARYHPIRLNPQKGLHPYPTVLNKYTIPGIDNPIRPL